MTKRHDPLSTRSPQCPTPAKMSFSTRAEAASFNERVHTAGHARLRAYRCPCGRWHLTRLTKREYTAIAKAAV